MADETVMRKFLIEIGYKLDTASQHAAMDAVNSLTGAFKSLATVMAALFAADKVIAFNKAMADAAYEAKRLGTTAQSLENFGKAGATAGASIGEMKQAVETLSTFIKDHSGPAVEKFLKTWTGLDYTKDRVTGNLKDMNGNLVKTDDVLREMFKNVQKHADHLTAIGKDGKAFVENFLKFFRITERQFNAVLDDEAWALKKRLDEDDELFNKHFQRTQDNAKNFVRQYTETMHILGDIYKEIMSHVDLAKPLEHFNDWMKAHHEEIEKGIGGFADKIETRVIPMLSRLTEELKGDIQHIKDWSKALADALSDEHTAGKFESRINQWALAFNQMRTQFSSDPTLIRDINEYEDRIKKGYKASPLEEAEQAERVREMHRRQEVMGEDQDKLLSNTKATQENTSAIDRFTQWLIEKTGTQGWWGERDRNAVNEQRARLGIGGSGAGGAGGGGGGATPGGRGGGGATPGGRGGPTTPGGRGGGGTAREYKETNDFYNSIINAEGTGKYGDPYNTSLGYMKSPKPLTDMTMDEALAWGDKIRQAQGLNSSAKGAFQIVNTTQRAAMKALGIGGNEKFSVENQRRMASWIARTQGLSAWEGFKSHPQQLAEAQAALGKGIDRSYSDPTGVASGSLQGVNPSLAKKISEAMDEYTKTTGKHATITSGFRSREEQARIYAESGYGSKYMAAPPGGSHHETGSAVDISPEDADEMQRLGILGRHGLHRPWGPENRRPNQKIDRPHIEELAMMINLENRRHAKHVTQPIGHNWTTINNETKQNTTNIDVGGLQTHVHLNEAQSSSVGLFGDVVRREHTNFAKKIRQMGTVIGT